MTWTIEGQEPWYVEHPTSPSVTSVGIAKDGVVKAIAVSTTLKDEGDYIVAALNAYEAESPRHHVVGSDDDETYEIGKRDGYSEAVQQIDQLTGGDGEYRYCTDHDPDRHTPGPAEMIQRIVDRFETLNLLRDAEKTGRDQEWGISAEPRNMQADHVALRDLVERAQAIIATSIYPSWHEAARAALSAPEAEG